MNKEYMIKEVSSQISTLKDHAEVLSKLLEDLQLTCRPTGDVSFSALDKSREVLDNLSKVRTSVEKIRRSLKARAQARMKEG